MPRFPPDAPDHGPESQNHETVEMWLRREGLPLFVIARHRHALLLARVSPFIVGTFYFDVARWLGTNVAVTVDDSAASLLVVLGAIGGWVLLPIATFRLTAALVREQPRRLSVVGGVLLGGFVLVEPWLEASWLPAALFDAGLVALALVATWLGVGSVVGWALRTGLQRVRSLGLVATRAVPLLMLVVIFAFFSRSLWQITGALSPTRLLAVTAFFVTLDLLVIVPLTRSEMSVLDARGDAEARTPPLAPLPAPPLSRLERANIQAVLILAQCLQVTLFFALVTAFLIVLGALAFPGRILADWAETDPTPFTIAGAALPFDSALVKTSLFLGCVSSLNFLVSASHQAAYTSAFYDPLFDRARAALAVRSAYLANPQNPDKLKV